jgi:hypothetical protein
MLQPLYQTVRSQVSGSRFPIFVASGVIRLWQATGWCHFYELAWTWQFKRPHATIIFIGFNGYSTTIAKQRTLDRLSD